LERFEVQYITFLATVAVP